MVAAILVFLGQTDSTQQIGIGPTFLLVAFGLILSIIGLLVIITLSLGYEHYITDITMILYCWDKMEFYRHPSKPVHFKTVYRWFFEITIALFAALLLYYVSQSRDWLITGFIIALIASEGIYQLWCKRYFDELYDFKMILKGDTGEIIWKKWDKWAKKTYFRDIAKKNENLIDMLRAKNEADKKETLDAIQDALKSDP